MWNGNAVAVRTFFLAVFIGSIAGCDGGVAPPQAAKSATDPARSHRPSCGIKWTRHASGSGS